MPRNTSAGSSAHDQDFIRCVHQLARYRDARDIFGDFCELSYCAIAKRTLPPGQKADALEQRYMTTIKAGDHYAEHMPRLLALTTMAMADCRDFLGPIAAGLNALNLRAGQHFTPPDVCELMARMVLDDFQKRIVDKGYFTLADPACGSGAMMLASANVVREGGYDPGQVMYVEATDIAPVCFKMAYIQLSLAGINARVICGDGLTGEEFESALTPAAVLSTTRKAGTQSRAATAEQKPRITSFARGPQDSPRLSAQRQRVPHQRPLAVGKTRPTLLTQRRHSNRED